MSNQPRLFVVRRAVSSLVLAAAFECLAHPVLVREVEEPRAAPQGVDRLPGIESRSDERLVKNDPLAPLPPPTVAEIRFDNPLPEQRQGVDEAAARLLGAAAALPGIHGNAFGPGDTLRNQLLRDFGNSSGSPAGAAATGLELGRPGGPSESGPGQPSPVNAVQAMLRDAIQNALKLVRDSSIDDSEMVNFAIVGVDFNLAVGGGRRSLTVNGSEVWPTILYDPLNEDVRQGPLLVAPVAMHGQGGQSAGDSGGSAQSGASALATPLPLDNRWGAGSTDLVSLLTAKVREIVTDPMTIMFGVGLLVFWIAYGVATAVRERRRLRHRRPYHRRHARARTRTA